MSASVQHPHEEEPIAGPPSDLKAPAPAQASQDANSSGVQKVFEGLVSFSPVEGSAPSMVVLQYLWLSKERRPALALSRVEGDKTNTIIMEPEDCGELEAKDDSLFVQVAGRKCTISWNDKCVVPGADVHQARSAFRRVTRRLTVDFARYWGFLEDNTLGMAYVTVMARRRTGTSSAAGSVRQKGSQAGSSKAGGSRAGDPAQGDKLASPNVAPAPAPTAAVPALEHEGEQAAVAAASTTAPAPAPTPSSEGAPAATSPVKAAPAPLPTATISVPPISKGVLQALHQAAIKAASKGGSRTSRTSDAPPVPLEPIPDDRGEAAASEPDASAHTPATIWLQPTPGGTPAPQGAGAGSKGTPRWASSASSQGQGGGGASSKEGKSSHHSSGRSGGAQRQAMFRASQGSRGAGQGQGQGPGHGGEEGGAAWSSSDRPWPGREGLAYGSPHAAAGTGGNSAPGSVAGGSGGVGYASSPAAQQRQPMSAMQAQQPHMQYAGQGQGMLRQPMQSMYGAPSPHAHAGSGWMYGPAAPVPYGQAVPGSIPASGQAAIGSMATARVPAAAPVTYGGQPMAYMYAAPGPGSAPGQAYPMYGGPSGHGAGGMASNGMPMLVPVNMPMDWQGKGQA